MLQNMKSNFLGLLVMPLFMLRMMKPKLDDFLKDFGNQLRGEWRCLSLNPFGMLLTRH
jgi:hypothetical protein